MTPVPNQDDLYLKRLQDYYARFRGLPSYSKLSELLGLASRSAVSKVLQRLRQAGYLERTPDDVWVPAMRFFERAVADVSVPAGRPVAVGEAGASPFAIDQYLVGTPSRTVLVPVRGDSMIEAGIHEGDVAVVECETQAMPGDIVVAVVDGEYTLKTLEREAGRYVLEPANSRYSVIRPKGRLEIFGVVVGLIRKYR
ncbi:MAG TPA: S24 family peptidase [Candidatus Ozemobacteraceae bacterium]|nr:S24 family peptidase [Candidatus Ozemobacteraceae bacterium]